MDYINRRNERYFLLQGTTKTGKPKYYCSKKQRGAPVAAMPKGYEWRENPENAIVTVRKIRPSLIATDEQELLSEAIRIRAGLTTFIVDISGDSLVAYLPDENPEWFVHRYHALTGFQSESSLTEQMTRNGRFSPMLRFVLRDEDERLFDVERWCFLGSIDRWMFLKGPAPLQSLIEEFVPHLGKESFFHLM